MVTTGKEKCVLKVVFLFSVVWGEALAANSKKINPRKNQSEVKMYKNKQVFPNASVSTIKT